jgi:hypothetical protein
MSPPSFAQSAQRRSGLIRLRAGVDPDNLAPPRLPLEPRNHSALRSAGHAADDEVVEEDAQLPSCCASPPRTRRSPDPERDPTSGRNRMAFPPLWPERSQGLLSQLS